VSGLAAIEAYNVTCSGNPECGEFQITPITSANELVFMVDRPVDYVDYSTQSMNFDPSRPISFIPTDLFRKLPAINQFTATGARIKTIHSNAFVNCTNLIQIMIAQNPIKSLPASFAEQCFRVSELHMYDNLIETIDEKALKGMVSLMNVYFRNNKITCLPPLLFQDNKGIQNIDFSSNSITALHPLLFQDMTQLYNVQFEMNYISYIPDLDLDHTGTVPSGFNMMLMDNPIMAINPLFLTHWFYDSNNNNNFYMQRQITFQPRSPIVITCVNENYQYPSPYPIDLYTIYGQNWYQQNISYTYSSTCYSSWTPQMADNSLVTCGSKTSTATTTTTTQSPGGGGSNGTDIIPVIPCSSYKICRYYLDYQNRYTCVIDGADGSVTAIGGIHSSPFTDASVERVYFVNSQLSRIPNVLFQKFPNLNFLYVRNCGMGVINDRTFNECGNLRFLDASHNDIIHIDETSLRNCTHLETIDLTGNPLDYVSTQLYVYDPSLKTVYLNVNSDFTLA
jgi:Leucine-rich repeat (LRR) protein